VPGGVANLVEEAKNCDCSRASWATCFDPSCSNLGAPCGTYPPCNPPTGIPPPPTAIHNEKCGGGYGRWCEDGLPPVALPSYFPACPQTSTPCNLLGPAEKGDSLQFAVIGDWGDNCCLPSCTRFVAGMIQRWAGQWPLDFIITTGDNFYPDGGPDALAKNMAAYDWIDPMPVPSQTPHFFPTLGNHDLYDGTCGGPYLNYFRYLGNGSSKNARYYSYSIPGGLVDLFSLNASCSEPDGNTVGGAQYKWLEKELANSSARWKIVYFHEPPFATHTNDEGTKNPMNWPFAAMGASIVLTGHMHGYERLERSGLTYVINGLGGVKGVDLMTVVNGCTPIKGASSSTTAPRGR